MKLRIKGNSIRLRLSQTEVAQFADRGVCDDSINFGVSTLNYSLEKGAETKAVFADNRVCVYVNENDANHWSSNETEVGISHMQPIGGGSELYILIEKDFACLTERPFQDESDNFPNPNTTC